MTAREHRTRTLFVGSAFWHIVLIMFLAETLEGRNWEREGEKLEVGLWKMCGKENKIEKDWGKQDRQKGNLAAEFRE